MKIELSRGDITTLKVDAIVNAANTSLLGGGGVDGAIHRAGGKIILEECMQIRNRQGGCDVGKAVITTAGNMPSKYVIHTVGPIYENGTKGENQLLYSAYRNSLILDEKHGVKSIAFSNISTGVYGFPKFAAAEIAIKAVRDTMNEVNIEKLIFVCFDDTNYRLYHELLELPS